MFLVSSKPIEDKDFTMGTFCFEKNIENAKFSGQDLLEMYDIDNIFIYDIQENGIVFLYHGFVPEPKIFWEEQ